MDTGQTIYESKLYPLEKPRKPAHSICSSQSEEIRTWSVIANFPISPSPYPFNSGPTRESQICFPINPIRCPLLSGCLQRHMPTHSHQSPPSPPPRPPAKPSLFSIIRLSHSPVCLWAFCQTQAVVADWLVLASASSKLIASVCYRLGLWLFL